MDHPVHDCFYLALSEAQNAPLVSADRRLIGKAKGRLSADAVTLSELAGRG
jgi:predicted nucleic acid-binding protein